MCTNATTLPKHEDRATESRWTSEGFAPWKFACLTASSHCSRRRPEPPVAFTRRDLREIFRLTFTASRAQSRYLPRQADRSTLRQILLCGLEDQVSFGKQCTRVEATALGATAHFADGTSAAATVLVGADGAGSQVRPSLLPNAQPVPLGYSAIYGTTNLNTSETPLVPGRLETSGVLAIGSPGKTFFFTTMAFRERPRDAFRRFMCKPPGRDQGDYVMWAISFPDASLPAATARGDPTRCCNLRRNRRANSTWLCGRWSTPLNRAKPFWYRYA